MKTDNKCKNLPAARVLADLKCLECGCAAIVEVSIGPICNMCLHGDPDLKETPKEVVPMYDNDNSVIGYAVFYSSCVIYNRIHES